MEGSEDQCPHRLGSFGRNVSSTAVNRTGVVLIEEVDSVFN